MTVFIDHSFEKDTDKISNKKLKLEIVGCTEQVQNTQSAAEIKNFKKTKGVLLHYRIRILEYRADVTTQGSVITFIRFLHPKDVYRYFP